MPKISEADVDDTVLIRGEIISFDLQSKVATVRFPGSHTSLYFNLDREVDEIVPKPWVSKVGDRIILKRQGSESSHIIIAINPVDKAWWIKREDSPIYRTVYLAVQSIYRLR